MNTNRDIHNRTAYWSEGYIVTDYSSVVTFQEREASKADKNESSNFTIINTFTH